MKALFTKEQDKIIAEKYLSGISAERIAKKYGCYKQSVLISLKRTNTPRRKCWGKVWSDFEVNLK